MLKFELGYENNKQNYSEYYGYLILKKGLTQEHINYIESNYQRWELDKLLSNNRK